MRTLEDLKMRQALPLDIKIRLTKSRIREWINEFGTDGVYVSFSGGKDSTALLNLVREDYPDVPAVFCDTGLEYPEIREFVKTYDNVTWVKPEMTFRKVIEKYGYPFISKEVSGAVHEVNRFFDLKGINQEEIESKGKLSWIKDAYESQIDFGYANRLPVRALQLIGKVPHKRRGFYTGEMSMRYAKERWGFMLDAPFFISNLCCKVMKKTPMDKYAKTSGRNARMVGMMAEESLARQTQWIQQGCNAFESRNPHSAPMSFWTEHDVLLYLKRNNIKIASVYGDIVFTDQEGMQYENTFNSQLKLKTTGCDRTGCMFCGYGCHLEKEGEGRFERMKVTHPKQYDYIMRPWSEGGLGFKEVIDWINENGNTHIRY